jgi:hypothetical protein
MNTTLLFFLLLIPLSGFIAWFGDRIGHRIGRRRQSLFGLRPRHTAILITIASGIGISVASFAGMLALSRSFRDVVARGGELARDNQRLARDNTSLTAEIRASQERLEASRSEVARAESEQRVAKLARDKALEQQRRARSQVDAAKRSLETALEDLGRERTRLGRTEEDLAKAQGRVDTARKALDLATRRQGQAEKRRQDAERRSSKAVADADAARAKVVQAERVFEQVTQTQRERLDEQRSLLRTQEADLDRQRSLLATQQERIREQEGTIAEQARKLEDDIRVAREQRAEVVRLSEEVADLGRRREELQASVDDIVRSANAVRRGTVTFRVGEEIARIPFAPGLSVWKVQNLLEAFLSAAAKKGEARGAKVGKGALRAVYIPEKTVKGSDGREQRASELDSLHAAALSIRAANEDVVVVLGATTNAVAGEPVPVEIKVFRNQLLYTAGSPIAELILPPDRPRQEILDRLYAFLSGEIRRRLLRSGLIPVNSGSEFELEPVGEAGVDALLKVMEEARLIGKARVVVRAAKDIRAGDQVALDFVVRPADPGSPSEGR